MKRSMLITCGIALCFCLEALSGRASNAMPSALAVLSHPRTIQASKHDSSRVPIREMPSVPPAHHLSPPHHSFVKRPAQAYTPDFALQLAPGATLLASEVLNFEGLGAGLPLVSVADPPDTNLSVGDNQVVETINFELAVFEKATGNLVYGPAALTTLWSGFGGVCETLGRGDPVVVFDKAAHRWVIAQLAGSIPPNSLPDTECVAVSQTSDATGNYYRYAFTLNPGQFVDYAKIGVWPDAYYLLNNTLEISGGNALAPEACALDRSEMLAGNSATAQCFFPNSVYSLFLPSDLDGSRPPPTGTPNYFLGLDLQSLALDLFKFHVDFSNPSNSTFTGPTQIPVQNYNNLSVGIPQPGVTDVLESQSGILMYRLAYRNFGDHDSLVANHTVDTGGGVAGIRWYEIRNPGAAIPTVYQQGTFSPDSEHRWMGSIAMDGAADIALGYSVSNSSTYPSIRYTGRVPADALGTLEAEATLMSGTGSDTEGGTFLRWGDYTSMSIDPVDDCTFWYANEYLTQTGPPPVHTRIGSFNFPTCTTRITNECPLAQGFWRNHPAAWPVTSLTLGSQTYPEAELLAVLHTLPRGDASLILSDQLIAAKLNLANGADPTPINATIVHADDLLTSFTGPLPYHVRPSSTTGQVMVKDASVLERYNDGELTRDCTP